jgi:hypothetical protein
MCKDRHKAVTFTDAERGALTMAERQVNRGERRIESSGES